MFKPSTRPAPTTRFQKHTVSSSNFVSLLVSRAARRSAVALAVAFALCTPASTAEAQGTTWRESWVGSEWELYMRALSVRGIAGGAAWSIRPVSPAGVDRLVRAAGPGHPWSARGARSDTMQVLTLLRPAISASYNSAFAWGAHDGPVWQGRGITAWATLGAAGRWRTFSARVEPSFSYAANGEFELRPAVTPPELSAPLAGIDLPQRHGESSWTLLSPGQSFLRADVGPAAIGFSSENLAWGPGIRHNLLVGGNAEGFPHVFVGTNRPIRTPVGAFAAQLLYASLAQSDWARSTESPRRFASGFVASWQPLPEFIELGAIRFYHQPWPERFEIRDVAAPFGSAFRDDEVAGTGGADNQLASVFTVVRAPALGLEVFGEFGKNDRSGDLRDLGLEPEHNAAWLLGALYTTKPGAADAHFWSTRIEIVNARIARIQDLGRGQALFYTHGRVAQGHTMRGQLLGTPLAEQSGGIELAVDRWAPWGRVGFTVMERQLPGDRSVGMPAGAERTQWDLGASGTVFRGAADVHVQAGHVWDLNRFPDRDVGNFYLRLGGRAAPWELFTR